MVQKDLGEKRAHWVTALQEYDLEIKPLKIVRGQGLCKLAAGFVDNSDPDLQFFGDPYLCEREVFPVSTTPDTWYDDIRFFLLHGTAPEHLDPCHKRALRLKSTPYQLIDKVLFRKTFEGILLRCLERHEADEVLSQLHTGPAGGHFSG